MSMFLVKVWSTPFIKDATELDGPQSLWVNPDFVGAMMRLGEYCGSTAVQFGRWDFWVKETPEELMRKLEIIRNMGDGE